MLTLNTEMVSVTAGNPSATGNKLNEVRVVSAYSIEFEFKCPASVHALAPISCCPIFPFGSAIGENSQDGSAKVTLLIVA
jgi:hypothetical protein